MPNSLRKYFICILFSVSAVSTQEYMNIDMTKERISLVFELSEMFLSFKTVFSFVKAPVVCPILASTSGLELSSDTTALGYFKLCTVHMV